MKRVILLCLLLPTPVIGDSICGDANGDGVVSIGDIVFQIDYLYNGGLTPDPLSAGDANGDSSVDISDAEYLKDFLFGSGSPPVELPPRATDNTSYDILFIGSSYFNYNDLPGIMRGLTDAGNKTVDIHTAITNGLYLADHATSITTEARINEKDWDYVVLQGVGRLVAYPDSFPTDHPVYPALQALESKIHANCAWTKMVFCLPWAYEDGMIWLDGWVDLYPEMQEKIYWNTLAYSDSIGFVIAPVGWAWNTVLETQGYPLHYLHMSDWNHPSLRGSYLMACAIYSTIFRESTYGFEYTAGISADDASYYQDVASRVVLDSLDLWRIMPPPAEIEAGVPPH